MPDTTQAKPTRFADFSDRVIAWQKQYGRHNLPWQGRDVYHVWLSEIMLQQTQVSTVLPYFARFSAKFPDVFALAKANEDEVLALWSGLGYYRRARLLHQAAQIIVRDFNGIFPQHSSKIAELPGIGRSTAAAIAAFAFNERAAILDGNVKRVLTRAFGIFGAPNTSKIENELWHLAESLLPKNAQHMPIYTQALMDLGSQVCRIKKPNCELCPLKSNCYAHQHQATEQLPEKNRPAKRKHQGAHWFWLEKIDNGERKILLQQQAQNGIWGGLWTFPADIFDLPAKNQAFNETRFTENAPQHAKQLATIKHLFTHITLFAALYKIKHCTQIPANINENLVTSPKAWFNAQELQNIAMPRPVEKLMRQFFTPT